MSRADKARAYQIAHAALLAATQAYRSRAIGDDAYLAVRHAFDAVREFTEPKFANG